jgi:hypothetical protein
LSLNEQRTEKKEKETERGDELHHGILAMDSLEQNTNRKLVVSTCPRGQEEPAGV